MKHQRKGLKLLKENPKHYYLACEQGTGKTWMLMADIEAQYKEGRINAVLVIAPKGVHTNWIKREIPKHMTLEPFMRVWRSGAGKRETAELKKILDPKATDTLRILAMNIDALNTKAGKDFAMRFVQQFDCMVIMDESSRIKTPTSGRTKKMIDIGSWAVSRRTASGTPMPNGPQDLFSQYEFLAPKKGLLGTTSYRAFVAEYTKVQGGNSGIMRHIAMRKLGESRFRKLEAAWKESEARRTDGLSQSLAEYLEQNTNSFFAPQIIEKDATGAPIYRNLDKLQKIIAPYTYRVLKKDCLDLPPKVYQTYDFELTPAQWAVYKEAEDKLRFERDTGELDTFTALTKLIKLRQIVSGFIMLDGEATKLMEPNPRLELLGEILEDESGQFIVWASFREEIKAIAKLMKKLKITCGEYHGGTKPKDREALVDEFQAGNIQCFIGQPQSGGIGLTLTAATKAFYYSNDFNSETRLQSEDRCHRIGTTESVLYGDIVAAGTVDERITAALQRKEEVAHKVLDLI